jgi:hypothetical protein
MGKFGGWGIRELGKLRRRREEKEKEYKKARHLRRLAEPLTASPLALTFAVL